MADVKVCLICGYTYDSEKGEERKGIEAGTLWEDVPEDFKCPLCGASKKMFK